MARLSQAPKYLALYGMPLGLHSLMIANSARTRPNLIVAVMSLS